MERKVFLTTVVTNSNGELDDALLFMYGVALGVSRSGNCKFHISKDSAMYEADILVTMTDAEYDRFQEVVKEMYPDKCMFNLY